MKRVLLWAAVAVLAVIAFAAVLPDALAPSSPLSTDVRSALLPPSAAGSEWPTSWVVERPSRAVIREEM